MKLSQLVSSVFVGLVAGLLGLVVVAVIRAGVAISHLPRRYPNSENRQEAHYYLRPSRYGCRGSRQDT